MFARDTVGDIADPQSIVQPHLTGFALIPVGQRGHGRVAHDVVRPRSDRRGRDSAPGRGLNTLHPGIGQIRRGKVLGSAAAHHRSGPFGEHGRDSCPSGRLITAA